MRIIKNWLGKLKGYSGCLRCGDTWNWKQHRDIPYAVSKMREYADGSPYYSGGMFPLCKECYDEISPPQRYAYCRQLWSRWGCPENKVDWDVVKKQVGLIVEEEQS